MQAFAPLFSGARRNSQHSVYTYSSKRSRTRIPSAFATSCKRPTEMSRRPFIQLFTVCRLTLIRSARSPSLTFFSSSLCADSTATHTVASSLLFCFYYPKKRRFFCYNERTVPMLHNYLNLSTILEKKFQIHSHTPARTSHEAVGGCRQPRSRRVGDSRPWFLPAACLDPGCFERWAAPPKDFHGFPKSRTPSSTRR